MAQEGPTQDQINAVARKLYCPVCENTPLDVCPTQACQNWRDEIRVALMEGRSEREILDDFARKYGDSVLAEPPPRQVVAWALPVVLVLAGVGAMAYWLRNWTRPETATAPLPVDEGPGMIEFRPISAKTGTRTGRVGVMEEETIMDEQASKRGSRWTSVLVWGGVLALLVVLGYGLLKQLAGRPEGKAPDFTLTLFEGYEYEGHSEVTLSDSARQGGSDQLLGRVVRGVQD